MKCSVCYRYHVPFSIEVQSYQVYETLLDKKNITMNIIMCDQQIWQWLGLKCVKYDIIVLQIFKNALTVRYNQPDHH